MLLKLIAGVLGKADIDAVSQCHIDIAPGVRRGLLRQFDEHGYSQYCAQGDMIGLFVDHCLRTDQPFKLEGCFVAGKVIGVRIVRVGAAVRASVGMLSSAVERRVLYDSTMEQAA